MYLIILESIAYTDTLIILGIAETKTGMFEVLWNYTLFTTNCLGKTYEEDLSYNEINIYTITSQNYEKLVKIYDFYKEVLEDNLRKLDYNYTPFFSCLWYGVFHGLDCDFNKSDCKRIKKIIFNSEKTLED